MKKNLMMYLYHEKINSLFLSKTIIKKYKHLMKKNLFILSAVLFSAALSSQVGINTTTPKSTLDVTAKNTDGTSAEGIIAPRLTGDQLKAGDAQYSTAQTGNLVYATSAVSTVVVGSKTENITSVGYYYFDGLKWQKMSGGTSGGFWSLTGNSGTNSASNFLGTLDNKDLIFKRNNIRAGLLNDRNTAFGQDALNVASTAIYNTAFGVSALAANTTGNDNTAIGYHAGFSQYIGAGNVLLGKDAGSSFIVPINNRLLITNNGNLDHLIDGDFAAKTLKVNGSFTSTTLSNSAAATTGNRPVVADANGQLLIGSTPQILRGSGTISSPLIDVGDTTTVAITLVGATINSVVSISPRSALPNGIIIAYVRVSAPNTISVSFQNNLGNGGSVAVPPTLIDIVVL